MTSVGAVARWGRGDCGRRPATLCAAFVAIVLACLLASPDALAADSYPRLANIYFPTLVGADLEKLARWDVLVLANRADEWYQDEIDTLRRLNPDIKLLVHLPVGYHGDWTAPSIVGDLRSELYAHNWWMKGTTGQKVILPFGSGLLNMTTWCPRDDHGKRLCDWLPEYIASRLGPGGRWDGVYLDFCMDDISWVNSYVTKAVDANNDHIADSRPELDAAWKLGMRRMTERLRELVGDDYIIVTNGNNTLYDACNGSTREDFPNMHGGWYENIMDESYGYVSIGSQYRQPSLNIVNGIWQGAAGPNGAESNPAYERQLRFALASTLVYGNGYFSFDGLNGTGGHCQAWWHPLYDVDLGQPVGRAERLLAQPGDRAGVANGDLLRMRRFTKGVAVVNPTPCAQSVSFAGTYYTTDSWNGQFYARTGAVSAIALQAYTGDVLVGSGHMLVGAPMIQRAAREGGGLTVSWDPIPGVARYSIYRAEGSGDGVRQDALVAVVNRSCYVDHSVAAGSTYRYAVAAIDSSGCEGQLSRPVEVSTEPGSDLQVDFMVDLLDGQLTLHWDVPDSLVFAAVRADAHGDRVRLGEGGPLPGGEGRMVDGTAVPGEAYSYELVTLRDGGERVLAVARAVAPDRGAETALIGCSPNPVAGETTISFSIGGAVGRGEVSASLTIYDAAGRVVRRLLDEPLVPGSHTVRWGADNERGAAVASGCYFCALEVGGRTHTGKLLVAR
jgi:hypothetical protein